ncbi:hypothetical protein [Prescottella equi]|uniref:hypothetical protein n=1 Tax=Rhodococcus hoagii TaxID=43767 RepID=UPI001F2C3F1B|nr:hypothetical protein [Prescottella equi]
MSGLRSPPVRTSRAPDRRIPLVNSWCAAHPSPVTTRTAVAAVAAAMRRAVTVLRRRRGPAASIVSS